MGSLDALTLATGEDWEGMLAVFDELAGVDDPVLRWARAPMRAGYARTAAHLGRAERAMAMLAPARPGADPGTGLDAELHPDGFGHRRDAVDARPS